LIKAQMISDPSTVISLNFLMFKFYFDLIASLVIEIDTHDAKKSSSAFLRALRRGVFSSPEAAAASLF